MTYHFGYFGEELVWTHCGALYDPPCGHGHFSRFLDDPPERLLLQLRRRWSELGPCFGAFKISQDPANELESLSTREDTARDSRAFCRKRGARHLAVKYGFGGLGAVKVFFFVCGGGTVEV